MKDTPHIKPTTASETKEAFNREVDARLFQDPIPTRGNSLRQMKPENSRLYWAVQEREAEIMRAAGFSG